jgi:uncharacterized protein
MKINLLKKLSVLTALAVVFSIASLAQETDRTQRSEIVPLADYHVHLLGPYALPLPEPLPPEVELPADLQKLLQDRAALIGNVSGPADLESVYATDAQLLEAHQPPNRWLRDKVWFERYLNLGSKGRSRFIPNQYRTSGTAGFIAGTVLDVPSKVHVSNFLLGIERIDGKWRIVSDNTTPKAPPRYPAPVTADRLIAELDEAGVQHALVLSEAFWVAGPGSRDVRRMKEAKDEPSAVRAENDWTAKEVSRYPDRLAFACSVSPLEDYSIEEVMRCARDLKARAVKLNFGSSGVKFEDPSHLAKVRNLFKAAKEAGLAIVVHLEPGRFYGPQEVEIFLNELVPAAPDTIIQIAHLAGNGPGITSPEALEAFAKAIASGDQRTKNLFFDLGGVVYQNMPPEEAKLMVTRMRQLGLDRVLFGSDRMAGVENPPIQDQWMWIRHLPLTGAELRTLASNRVAALLPPTGTP